jgi:hypothetical protein
MRFTFAGVCLLMLSLAPLDGRAEKEGPVWGYALDLKCRPSGQPAFEKARTFGVEVYRDEKGRALYITETGVPAVGEFGKLEPGKHRPPTWLHKLDVKVRPIGFEPPPKAFGMEVFRDEQNGHWLYVCETGAVSVLPGAGPFEAANPAKAAGWLHGLVLKVRKAGQEKFDRDTPGLGFEVYLDGNNGNLVYIGERGMLAVVPGAKDTVVPTGKAKPPAWLYSCNLKVRKAGPQPDQFASFWVEVYRDENNGNLIYLSETGSLAVVAGKQMLPAPVQQPKAPTLTRQFDLKCRKASETDFGSMTFGIGVFADANSNCVLAISEKGMLAAEAAR